MKVTVDTGRCVASGQCALLAPDTFDQRDDDGVVSLRNDNPPADQHDLVHHAELACPSGAITVLDS